MRRTEEPWGVDGPPGSPILLEEVKDDVDEGKRANHLQQVPAEYYDWVSCARRIPLHKILRYLRYLRCGWLDWVVPLVI